MTKSNVLKIVLSVVAGLMISCVVLVAINLINDNRKSEQANSSSEVIQETNKSGEDRQAVVDTNNEDNLQNVDEIKTTESDVQENTEKVDSTIENKQSETQNVGNNVNNQQVKQNLQQQNQSVSNTNKIVSSGVATQNQSTNSSTNSSQSTSNNGSKNTNSNNSTNNTTPTVKQNNNTSNYYILNKNSKVFHYSTCGSVKKMKDSNKIEFHGSRNDVISKGYRPCQNCKP